MNIALYGGSFDPPHAGHVHVALKALEVLDIERLIIVPAYRNPFKSSIRVDGEQRLAWLKEIFAPYPKITISDFEIAQQRSVYTIETVEHFAPIAQVLYLIVGADNLDTLASWNAYERLCKKVTWVIAKRDNLIVPSGMITLEVNEPFSSTNFRENFDSLGLEPTIENKIITTYKEKNESTN
jgi:nicotinate-nucleotide adenylyltransferase